MSKTSASILLLLLFGCGRSPYAGYKDIGHDTHLHFHVLGDGEVLPTDSDSVQLVLRMGWAGQGIGELFSTEGRYAVQDLRTGAFVPVLHRIHEGDSMSLIAPASAWPWQVIAAGAEGVTPDTGMVQVELALRNLRTPAMARAEEERFRRNDPLGYERRLIAAYLEQDRQHFVRWGTSDLHFEITGTATDTAQVRIGDHVTIAYRGVRVEDGQVFDDTERNGHPLSFNYGDKDQVMNGLEVAVTLLRNGQEGRFIFPSTYAFGAKGIPGVLDPYMPVEYTVRLEDVQRGAKEQAVR